MSRPLARPAALLVALPVALFIATAVAPAARAQEPVPAPPVARPLPAARDTAPPLDALFDVPALRARLAALGPSPDTAALARTFRVQWGTAGQAFAPVLIAPMREGGWWRDSVFAALKATQRAIPPREALLQRHVELRTGPDPYAALRDLVVEDVRLADPSRLRRQLQQAVEDLLAVDESLVGAELTARVQVTVDRDGSPGDLRLLASTGRAALDEAALRLVRQSRFVPMHVNGSAVKSLAVLPLRFIFPED